MRDQDADYVAKPRRTSRCCNSMGSRAFCDTRTGGMLIGYARVSTQETREESPEKRRRTPLTTFWAAETQLGTHSLCQEPSETGALSPSTLVRNAPLSVQNRTNLPDTLYLVMLPSVFPVRFRLRRTVFLLAVIDKGMVHSFVRQQNRTVSVEVLAPKPAPGKASRQTFLF